MAADLILHLTTRDAWIEAVHAGVYRHPSLESEGFIHASTRQQAVASANIYYRGRPDLVVVCVDTERLSSELRWDESKSRGESFPHVYGPINLSAVTQVLEMRPAEGGGFEDLPTGIEFDSFGSSVWLRAVNYDGSRHWDHPALLAKAGEDLIVTRTGYGTLVARETGSYVSLFNTRAHYWPDRWFNVIRLQDAGHHLEGFYCNIARPLPFDGSTVSYVDMQLDVRVFAGADGGLSWRLLDEDEFEEARARYAYPQDVVDRCYAAVDELIEMVKRREYPFDE